MAKQAPNALVGSKNKGNVKRKEALVKPKPKAKVSLGFKPKVYKIPIIPFSFHKDKYEKDEAFRARVDTMLSSFFKKEKGSVLVVDCWDGFVCSMLIPAGFDKITGMDIGTMAIVKAKENVKQVEFINNEYMNSPMDFDYIVDINYRGNEGIAGFIDKALSEAKKGIFIATKIPNGDGTPLDICEEDFKEISEGLNNCVSSIYNDGKNVYLDIVRSK